MNIKDIKDISGTSLENLTEITLARIFSWIGTGILSDVQVIPSRSPSKIPPDIFPRVRMSSGISSRIFPGSL